jgi:nucleoid-associated protein YgaU
MRDRKSIAIIVVAALAVLVPGVLALRFWPGARGIARVNQAPAVPADAGSASGPLASFDLRDAGSGFERVKLWVTPPRSRLAYGIEFVCRGGALNAMVQRRGAAERTPVPMAASWIDRLNAAIRGTGEASPESAARREKRGIVAEMVVERPGEVPGKFAVRFDPEGPGWAVLDEILSHYGLADYTVKRGDTPAGIAKKLLGDSRRWPDILELNPGLKPERMQPGDVIHVPRK